MRIDGKGKSIIAIPKSLGSEPPLVLKHSGHGGRLINKRYPPGILERSLNR